MQDSLRLYIKRIFSVLILASVSACSVAPLKTSRRGLFDQDGAYAGKKSNYRKTASEAFPVQGLKDISLPGVWQWPLADVEISSSYGERGRKFHQGVDLRAHVGTQVLAAADGEVVYVGNKIRGYGRMVVLKHDNGFFAVYAHHSKNLVKAGDRIDRGQVIALSGKSGRSRGAHLHFELRRVAQSIDPEYAFNDFLKRPANRKIASKSKHKDHYEV